MVSLVDIVPQTRTVKIQGGDVVLRGLGLRQIADLLLRFPSLRNIITQGAPALELETLLVMAPEALAAIIAEAANESEAEATIADALSIDDISACLTAIVELTMPSGPVPFFLRIAQLVNLGVGLSGKDQDTILPPMPNGSLPADTQPATS
jgi:hypothetical protein